MEQFGVLHRTALHSHFPCLPRANWRYAAFLKFSIQNREKLISLAWISLQLLHIVLICLKEAYSWKYPIWCQEIPSLLQHKSSCSSGTGLQTPLGSVLRRVRFFFFSRISRKIEVISSLCLVTWVIVIFFFLAGNISLKKCNYRRVSYFIKKNTDFDCQKIWNDIDESVYGSTELTIQREKEGTVKRKC